MEIKKWLETGGFDQEVKDLFEESIVCYKAEAFRASLLYSYLGFMTVLKQRVLNATKEPSGFALGEWNNKQKELRNEGGWDLALFKQTQTKPPKAIFEISDDLRIQIKYWKDRRNDCAHAKKQLIKHYHVESFWAFLYSNMPKLVLGGSYDSLINRIDDHFDTNKTALESSYENLVNDIQHCIQEDIKTNPKQKASPVHHHKNNKYKTTKTTIFCNDSNNKNHQAPT